MMPAIAGIKRKHGPSSNQNREENMSQQTQTSESAQKSGANRMRKLRHIAIVTLDPTKLAKFYGEVFDMKIVHQSQNGSTFMTDGTITLALLKNKAEGKPVGLNHIGFHVDSRNDVGEQIKEWGLDEPAPRPADRPYAEVRITDPDGNNIDLSENGFDQLRERG
jgi:catechol-2,3-dioxygenase